MNNIGFIAYVAFAVIFAGLFTFVGLQSSGVDPTKEAERPVNQEYLNLEAPIIEELENRSWDEPPAQDSNGNWKYEVFTPPKIYIDDGKNFTAVPPKGPEPVDPEPVENASPVFGVALQSLHRPPFRVLLRGAAGNPQDPTKTLVQLDYLNISPPSAGMTEPNILGKTPIYTVVGKYLAEQKIRIIKHSKVDTVVNGLTSKTDKVWIEDFTTTDPATNKVYTVELMTSTIPVPGPDLYVTLLSPGLPPIFQKNLSAGFKFKLNLKDIKGNDYEAMFTVIDLKESPPSITLHKEYKWVKMDGEPPIDDEATQTLNISSSVVSAPGAGPIPGSIPSSGLPSSTLPGGAMPVPAPGLPPVAPLSPSSGPVDPDALPPPSSTLPF